MEQTSNPSDQPLFTCLSCSIAFPSAEDQREHYRSDHHRYNMKRRVASLPPVSAAVFNQKVLERRAETAVALSAKDSTCTICNKVYSSENAYRSHMNSKKHKETELKAANAERREDIIPSSAPSTVEPATSVEKVEEQAEEVESSSAAPPPPESASEDSDDDVMQTIDQKIAAARARLSPTHCLFCSSASDSLEDNLTHMASAHSFFVPDAEYLTDLPGLISYLGEKIAVGNVCLYCNDKGKEFRTLEAVRKHMLDKSHCKVAYDTEDDRLELSDFYDFTKSYANVPARKRRTKKALQDAEWEDVDGEEGDEVDEIVDNDASDEEGTSEGDVDEDQVTYGDTPYELVLSSGARIGHRSLRRYYGQRYSTFSHTGKEEGSESGAAFVRRLLADKNSALVPRSGGFGAFGKGTDVVKARNRGEAREAGRHVREFRDQKRREDFKTKMGFVGNNQKHFRDPLLQ